jgi:hypothetical protein
MDYRQQTFFRRFDRTVFCRLRFAIMSPSATSILHFWLTELTDKQHFAKTLPLTDA